MKKILCTAPQYCCGGAVNISDNSLIKNLNGNVAELTAPDHNQKSFATQGSKWDSKCQQMVFFSEYLTLFYCQKQTVLSNRIITSSLLFHILSMLGLF